MAYVKLVGTSNPSTNLTAEIILKKNDDGSVKESVKVGEPVNLSADKRKKLEARGYVFEDSSSAESKEVKTESKEEQPVGEDVAKSGPLFGDSGDNNQGTGSVFGRSRSEKK